MNEGGLRKEDRLPSLKEEERGGNQETRLPRGRTQNSSEFPLDVCPLRREAPGRGDL